MADTPLDQKAREVAEWLGWIELESDTTGAAFRTGSRLTEKITLLDHELSTLHAACLRERRLRGILVAALGREDDGHRYKGGTVSWRKCSGCVAVGSMGSSEDPRQHDDGCWVDEARNALKEIDHA